MAWTVTVRKETGNNGTRLLALTYTSDQDYGSIVDRFEVREGIEDVIVASAKDRLKLLDEQDQVLGSLVESDLETRILNAKDDPPVLEDPAEAARREFFTQYNKLKAAEVALEKGLIKADDATLSALRVSVKELYSPDYLGFIG